MFEVELKAHVDDRQNVIDKLNGFAKYLETVQKDDVYWGIFSGEGDSKRKIQARIRREKNIESGNEKIYLTYKRKEVRLSEDGTACEVNDEKECTVSESSALEALFQDLGMKIVLEKHKKASGWQFEDAHIELCTIPPLGDFLEIEIMSEKNDSETVNFLRGKIINILKKVDIPEEKIENKYYSELLREAENIGGK